MKATDDILIFEYWLSDLVSWDNTASHRITVLSWSQAAYFRHRESSIKLYPNHQLTEGVVKNRNWTEEHQKQSCTSRGHLFLFSPSLPLKMWTAFLAVACFFLFFPWWNDIVVKHTLTNTQIQRHSDTLSDGCQPRVSLVDMLFPQQHGVFIVIWVMPALELFK